MSEAGFFGMIESQKRSVRQKKVGDFLLRENVKSPNANRTKNLFRATLTRMKRDQPPNQLQPSARRRIVVVKRRAPRGQVVECAHLPEDMWACIASKLSNVDDMVALNRTCKLTQKATEIAHAEILGWVRSFIVDWAGLSKPEAKYVTAFHYFWEDQFEAAGRRGDKRWMCWLPNPIGFSTKYDAVVCKEALKAKKFEFLEWTQTQGYRFYFVLSYQGYYYMLKAAESGINYLPPSTKEDHTKKLDWLTNNMGNYNMDGATRPAKFNPLNVSLKHALFYPLGSGNMHFKITEAERPYWKR
jgi:hypothetical protein